jgi:hypothetical protein
MARRSAGSISPSIRPLTYGGTIDVVGEERRDLERVGGVATLLRF